MGEKNARIEMQNTTYGRNPWVGIKGSIIGNDQDVGQQLAHFDKMKASFLI